MDPRRNSQALHGQSPSLESHTPRPLALFDVDGTLCDTVRVDDECYRAVAAEMLNLPVDGVDWEPSPQRTDTGIAHWLWERHLGRTPTEDEIGGFLAAFEAALERELGTSPERFAAIQGAPQLLDYLGRSGWIVGIATGGWGPTARLKLRTAGIPTDLLLASSDDAIARTAIFGLAHSRATTGLDRTASQTVLIGDSDCDVGVAAHFGWAFVGVGKTDRSEALRATGATHVVPDHADLRGTLAAFRDCQVPGKRFPPTR